MRICEQIYDLKNANDYCVQLGDNWSRFVEIGRNCTGISTANTFFSINVTAYVYTAGATSSSAELAASLVLS